MAEIDIFELTKYQTPIYAADDRVQPEIVATGTFVKLNGIFFLLTASHVLEEFLKENEAVIRLDDEERFLPIRERKILFSPSKGVGGFDLAIVQIPDQHVDGLMRNNKFYDLKPLLSGPNRSHHSDFIISGFPVNRQRPNREFRRTRELQQAQIIVICTQSVLPESELWKHYSADKFRLLDSRFNAFMEAGKGRINLFKLDGCSGGGLWEVDGCDTDEQTCSAFRLSAITTDRLHGQRYVLGTRIEAVLNGLSRKWPEAIRS